MADDFPRDPATRPEVGSWSAVMHIAEEERAEVLGGRIHYRTMTRAHHGYTASRAQRYCENRANRSVRGGWWVVREVHVRLNPDDVVVPDVAGWRIERLPEIPTEFPVATLPEWVCEVLSPSTQAYDRGEKAQAYLRAGVQWMWLVDPEACTVEVRQALDGRWTVFGVWGADATVAVPPFDEEPLDLASLFAPPKGR